MPSIRMGPAGTDGSAAEAAASVDGSALGVSAPAGSVLEDSLLDGSAEGRSDFFTTFVCTVVVVSAPIMRGIGPVGSGREGAFGRVSS